MTEKFQDDFYDDDQRDEPAAIRLIDNPLFAKLFTNLDDENRDLLLHALIDTAGTQYKNI